jgi:hypothetical protein
MMIGRLLRPAVRVSGIDPAMWVTVSAVSCVTVSPASKVPHYRLRESANDRRGSAAAKARRAQA